ncbi:hypothetical protein [Granulicatella elegans]|jgi:hypothetical protein|uniref:hypothetical protein n=1 Tax=Granulicatella elegans TaxID=137732 RepID=UPI000F273FA2|nr:hypothetical protein [Granulicatella elegans]RKW27767.1 MAG: hypothetical protein D8B48_05325 [Granulicatella sp.]
MATKSFSTTLTFNRKSTDSLLHALENNKKANLEDISNAKIVKSSKEILNLFNKSATRKDIQ